MNDAHVSPKLQRAERQLEQGNPNGAVETLRSVLAEDPGLAEAHALLAMALFQLKRVHAAMYEARLALSLAPEEPFAHRAMGVVCLGHRDTRGAALHLEQAMALEPNDTRAMCLLAATRTMEGRRDEATALLEKARSLDPEDPSILVDLGEQRLACGAVDEAERFAREALAIEADHRDALVLMGSVALRRGRVDEAREHARWALRQDAGHLGALWLLSGVKARESRFLGLWWRYNVWMSELGERRSMLVLLGAFVVYRVAHQALLDLEQAALAEAIGYVWLALCVYTWVGPSRFRAALERELRQVSLRDDF